LLVDVYGLRPIASPQRKPPEAPGLSCQVMKSLFHCSNSSLVASPSSMAGLKIGGPNKGVPNSSEVDGAPGTEGGNQEPTVAVTSISTNAASKYLAPSSLPILGWPPLEVKTAEKIAYNLLKFPISGSMKHESNTGSLAARIPPGFNTGKSRRELQSYWECKSELRGNEQRRSNRL